MGMRIREFEKRVASAQSADRGDGAQVPKYASRRQRLWRRMLADERGQNLVEFALVLPALLAVLTGIFSFGVIFNQYEILTNAASSGARAAAMSRSGSTALDTS